MEEHCCLSTQEIEPFLFVASQATYYNSTEKLFHNWEHNYFTKKMEWISRLLVTQLVIVSVNRWIVENQML
jgi:hypothetical protein